MGEGLVSGEGLDTDDVEWVDVVHHFATNGIAEPG